MALSAGDIATVSSVRKRKGRLTVFTDMFDQRAEILVSVGRGEVITHLFHRGLLHLRNNRITAVSGGGEIWKGLKGRRAFPWSVR